MKAAPLRRGNFGAALGANEISLSLRAAFSAEVGIFITLLDGVNASTVHPLMFYDGAVGIPSIKLMAYATYSLQATSAASESSFSQGRRTMIPERSGLQSKRAGRLITSAMRHKISKVSSNSTRSTTSPIPPLLATHTVTRPRLCSASRLISSPCLAGIVATTSTLFAHRSQLLWTKSLSMTSTPPRPRQPLGQTMPTWK